MFNGRSWQKCMRCAHSGAFAQKWPSFEPSCNIFSCCVLHISNHVCVGVGESTSDVLPWMTEVSNLVRTQAVAFMYQTSCLYCRSRWLSPPLLGTREQRERSRHEACYPLVEVYFSVSLCRHETRRCTVRANETCRKASRQAVELKLTIANSA